MPTVEPVSISALPLFAAFALAPFRLSQAIWYVFNLVSLMLIVRLVQLDRAISELRQIRRSLVAMMLR